MLDNIESHKDSILFNSGWLAYGSVMAVSIWGGLVSYFEKREKFSWSGLTAQLLSSSFAGMMTALVCQYANLPTPLMGALSGVAAYMGTPAMVKLARKLKWVRELMDSKDGDK
jgi:hypothetical protein